jgi:hypothetical protein
LFSSWGLKKVSHEGADAAAVGEAEASGVATGEAEELLTVVAVLFTGVLQ